MPLSKKEKTEFVRKEAFRLGFNGLGISRAIPLEEEAAQLRKWLDEGRQGEMQYLENHFDKRIDPVKLHPGTKSIVSLTFNYHNPVRQKDPQAPIVASYAYGRDYHKVLKKKLKSLLVLLKEEIGVQDGRAFVDSAPVMERVWAARSGLGWIGKNTLLIHPKKGSFFFLAELFLDVELDYDQALEDHCGKCKKCIEACPTSAIDPQGYTMDASRCISYATIEKKGPIPSFFQGKMEERVFGCDICQDVCPWNKKFSIPTEEEAFQAKREMLELSRVEWQNMDQSQYEKIFNGTPVRRAKYEGLRRNIAFLDNYS